MSTEDTKFLAKDLKALGLSQEVNANTYFEALTKGDPFDLLERFPAPTSIEHGLNDSASYQTINLRCPEFTSLCPLTGQPDFATIVIDYEPGEWCVESKALKLYLMSFRNRGEFHEACVNRICNDLVKLLAPIKLTVKGEFTPRGGIPIWPTSNYDSRC